MSMYAWGSQTGKINKCPKGYNYENITRGEGELSISF